MTQEDLAESLLVLYASQTGNAEWIARHISSEAQERGFSSSIFTLNDHALVFIISFFSVVQL
jgi:methionine synthase reductase